MLMGVGSEEAPTQAGELTYQLRGRSCFGNGLYIRVVKKGVVWC